MRLVGSNKAPHRCGAFGFLGWVGGGSSLTLPLLRTGPSLSLEGEREVGGSRIMGTHQSSTLMGTLSGMTALNLRLYSRKQGRTLARGLRCRLPSAQDAGR